MDRGDPDGTALISSVIPAITIDIMMIPMVDQKTYIKIDLILTDSGLRSLVIVTISIVTGAISIVIGAIPIVIQREFIVIETIKVRMVVIRTKL